MLLNNIKDVKLNQTHSSENYIESMLQNQIKELKYRSKTMKDKLTIFLKLMKKYSSKLTTLTHLSSNNNIDNNQNNNSNSINNEIQSTLSHLNNMLNNPKLNEDIFELPDLTTDLTNNNISINTKEDEKLNFNQQSLTIPVNTNFNINTNQNDDEYNNIINNLNSNINEENNYAKDIQGLINKYEEKINLLNNENKALKKSKEEQNILQNDLVNKNISLENEINSLKKQIEEDKKNYESVLQQLDSASKLSINLKKKLEFLEGENNDIEVSSDLPNNIEQELKYKDNIIKYLESLLKKKNVNPKLLTEDIYKKEYLKSKEYKNKNSNYLNNFMKDENEKGLTYNNINMINNYLDSNSNLEGCINFNNYNDYKKGKMIYSNSPDNNQDLFSNTNSNAKLIKTKNEKNKNINEENIENESRNFFSFYNWGGQTNSNSNLVEYKKIYNSNFNSPKMVQKEIDDIDKEIIELQTKFKQLLSEQ